MQFLIPLKKYNIFLSPIKTSLMEHFRGEAVEVCTRPARPLDAAPARSSLIFTNRTGFCTVWNKELIIKLTNYCTGFIAFRGIICMNFTSLVNNPVTVINKTEIGG